MRYQDIHRVQQLDFRPDRQAEGRLIGGVGQMNNIVLPEEEMQEEIRSAIVAHCDPITRDAVLAWFDRRVVIAQALVELGLDRNAVA
jgi:hypothetical protein